MIFLFHKRSAETVCACSFGHADDLIMAHRDLFIIKALVENGMKRTTKRKLGCEDSEDVGRRGNGRPRGRGILVFGGGCGFVGSP